MSAEENTVQHPSDVEALRQLTDTTEAKSLEELKERLTAAHRADLRQSMQEGHDSNRVFGDALAALEAFEERQKNLQREIDQARSAGKRPYHLPLFIEACSQQGTGYGFGLDYKGCAGALRTLADAIEGSHVMLQKVKLVQTASLEDFAIIDIVISAAERLREP